jgi:hypothetical protein
VLSREEGNRHLTAIYNAKSFANTCIVIYSLGGMRLAGSCYQRNVCLNRKPPIAIAVPDEYRPSN